jgi:adenylyltransferase/sulfurtransferase
MRLNLTDDDRYARQIVLPEMGQAGQEKLRNAKVFVVGAGGLASAAAFYLSAAGIGTLGIADDDHVEISNLNRQILHNFKRIGMQKVLSAQQTIASFSPDIQVRAYPAQTCSAEDTARIFEQFDAVVDCTDNFEARSLINESCILAQKPWVYGAVSGFEGQVMTIVPGKGPCYRCLYPVLPPKYKRPGVIGISPGIIGILQAAEIIKYILGKGSLLIGRMLYIDLLEMDFSELSISRNPDCGHCNGYTGKKEKKPSV